MRITLRRAFGVLAPAGACLLVATNLGPLQAVAAGAPGPSTSLVASAGPMQAALTWTPPVDDGGAPITNYAVFTYPVIAAGVLVTPDQTPSFVVTGLAPDTYYTFTVTAFNGSSWGAWSAYSAYVLTPPQAPPPAATFTQSVIDAAVATPPIRIATGDGIPAIYQAKVLLYLTLVTALEPT